jgi:hypothetical protein
MKALGVALALAILLTANEGRAAGGYISGQRLNELCSDESTSFNEGLCWGYIAGVYDAGKALDTATNKRQWSAGWTACVPDGVLAGQLVEVVKKWLSTLRTGTTKLTASWLRSKRRCRWNTAENCGLRQGRSGVSQC